MLSAPATDINENLLQYKDEVTAELNAILSWWSEYMIDNSNGGFYGSVSNKNIPDSEAPKGIVLNSRILYTFSAAYNFTKTKSYLDIATRAYQYILNCFMDHEHGGIYWSVNSKGIMLDGKKQIYGLAFCIYGLAEFYKINKNNQALQFATDLYRVIEKHSYDKSKKGYIEAFTREWNDTGDLRLSNKDDNERKTMNTHLHIIEAYANLYSVWRDETLRTKIGSLLELFDTYFINKENYHLNLFFNEDWVSKSSLISYGHDIEAAWLLQRCAEIAGHGFFENHFKELSVFITDAATEGLDDDGGMWYEYNPDENYLIKEKHSWCQAEAMIGFYNAYQLTRDKKYIELSRRSWSFIKKNILDKNNGEWFWGVYADGSVMNKEKAGFWKCPYHSSRACIEIIQRINEQLK